MENSQSCLLLCLYMVTVFSLSLIIKCQETLMQTQESSTIRANNMTSDDTGQYTKQSDDLYKEDSSQQRDIINSTKDKISNSNLTITPQLGQPVERTDYLRRHQVNQGNQTSKSSDETSKLSESKQFLIYGDLTPTQNNETSNILNTDTTNTSKQENNSFFTNITLLQDNLQQNVLDMWSYSDYIKSPGDLMLDQGLINRARISVSSGKRLRSMFDKAMRGEDIQAALISSSVSRAFSNDPTSKQWLYPNALLHWWTKVITPVTKSRMLVKDVSIAGVGSDYFSRCLKNHLPDEGDMNLILWELSGSDYKPHGKLRPLDAQSLERF